MVLNAVVRLFIHELPERVVFYTLPEKLSSPLLCLGFKIWLDMLYIFILYPVNNQWSLEYSIITYLVSCMLAFGVGFFIPQHKESPVVPLFGWLMGAFGILPLLSYAGLSGVSPSEFLFVALICISFYITLVIPQKTGDIRYLGMPEWLKIKKTYFPYILISTCLIALGDAFLSRGLPQLDPIFLQNTLEIRSNVSHLHPVLAYVESLARKVALPTLFVWYVHHSRIRSKIIHCLILWFCLYLYYPFGSLLVTPAFVIGAVFVLERRELLTAGLLTTAAASTVIIALSYFITPLANLRFVIAQRLYYWIARGHVLYYKFFTTNDAPFIWYTNTPLGIGSYPFSDPIQYVVSDVYLSEHGMNIGIYGEAFSQSGYLGIVLHAIILGAVLVFIKSNETFDSKILISMVIFPFWLLTQVGLSVSLLTNGLWFPVLTGLIFYTE